MVLYRLNPRVYDDLRGLIVPVSFYKDIVMCDSMDLDELNDCVFTRLISLLKLYKFDKSLPNNTNSEDVHQAARTLLNDIRNEVSVVSSRNLEAKKDGDSQFYGGIENETMANKQRRFRRNMIASLNESNSSNSGSRASTVDSELEELKDDIGMTFISMAYAGTTNDEWLCEMETKLFETRLAAASMGFTNDEVIESCIRDCGIEIITVTDPELLRSLELPDGRYYSTRISEALSQLIYSGNCLIDKGITYFSRKMIHTVLIGQFSVTYRNRLKYMKSNKPKITNLKSKHTHIAYILETIQSFNPCHMARVPARRFSDSNFTPLTMTSIGGCMKRLPPCMVSLLNSLVISRHLSYESRLQLWPFLKDCGMSLDEQILLAKQHWNDSAKFIKEHKYTLRHMYGLEGKRLEKNCYECSRLIGDSRQVMRAESGGCPLVTKNMNTVRSICQEYGVESTDIEEIGVYIERGEHAIGCRRIFESIHKNADSSNVGISPVSFYRASEPLDTSM